MNDSIRKTILLHLNTEDVEKKMSSWKTELADIRSALSYCAERFFWNHLKVCEIIPIFAV